MVENLGGNMKTVRKILVKHLKRTQDQGYFDSDMIDETLKELNDLMPKKKKGKELTDFLDRACMERDGYNQAIDEIHKILNG